MVLLEQNMLWKFCIIEIKGREKIPVIEEFDLF